MLPAVHVSDQASDTRAPRTDVTEVVAVLVLHPAVAELSDAARQSAKAVQALDAVAH